MPEAGDDTSFMAVHSGTQEWLSAFSHYAATSCRIAGGPKRHLNSNLQQDNVAEILEGDLQSQSVFSQGFD